MWEQQDRTFEFFFWVDIESGTLLALFAHSSGPMVMPPNSQIYFVKNYMSYAQIRQDFGLISPNSLVSKNKDNPKEIKGFFFFWGGVVVVF